MTPEDWAILRQEIIGSFTPGQPINEADLFAGRSEQIQNLKDTALEPGKHGLIYGERGVGKTSIANIFYRDLNTELRPVLAVRVNCDTFDDFVSLWRKVFRRIKYSDSVNGSEKWADQSYTNDISLDNVQIELSTFNENQRPIIILDEFDRITDENCKILITDLIKALSDYSVNCTVIIVGVAKSVTDLLKGHESIARALRQVRMPRMSQEEMSQIVLTRLRRTRMRIDDDALWRITFFSSGLPFYTHSLGKYSALCAITQKRLQIREVDVFEAMLPCINDVDFSIKESYVRATERIYRKDNIFKQVLAGCALAEVDPLGEFNAAKVEKPLSAIMGDIYKTQSFAFHLNELSKPARGRILSRSGERRTYKLRFVDPLMQPYIVMNSLSENIITPEILERFAIKRQKTLSI
jgi:DNA polymerase III delta prime subunit